MPRKQRVPNKLRLKDFKFLDQSHQKKLSSILRLDDSIDREFKEVVFEKLKVIVGRYLRESFQQRAVPTTTYFKRKMLGAANCCRNLSDNLDQIDDFSLTFIATDQEAREEFAEFVSKIKMAEKKFRSAASAIILSPARKGLLLCEGVLLSNLTTLFDMTGVWLEQSLPKNRLSEFLSASIEPIKGREFFLTNETVRRKINKKRPDVKDEYPNLSKKTVLAQLRRIHFDGFNVPE